MGTIKEVNCAGYTFEIEVGDPMLQTHCARCWNNLTPEWKLEQGKQHTIGNNALCAVCWRCCMRGRGIKRPEVLDEEVKEERRARRKKPAPRMTKKKQAAIMKRAAQLNRRPCGCGARGRHRKDCPEASK